MPWYKIASASPDEEDSLQYAIRVIGDGDSIGPDVCAQVKAKNRRRAAALLKTTLRELKSWNVLGISIPTTDERMLSLVVVTPGVGLPFVEACDSDGETSYLFMSSGDGKKGAPRLEAKVRASSPKQAVEILVSELAPHSIGDDEPAVIPIELKDEGSIQIRVLLDHKSLRPWLDPAAV